MSSARPARVRSSDRRANAGGACGHTRASRRTSITARQVCSPRDCHDCRQRATPARGCSCSLRRGSPRRDRGRAGRLVRPARDRCPAAALRAGQYRGTAGAAVRPAPSAPWTIDFVTLVFVLQSGDWRSPFYLLWLASLALPATSLPLRRAVWLAVRGGPHLPRSVDRGRSGPGPASAGLDRDARDPCLAPVHARRRARLRRRGTAPLGRRAFGARAARDRGGAAPDRLGAARFRQAAAARSAPPGDVAARPRARAARAHRLARGRRTRVGRIGHGHEPRRAALPARRPATPRRVAGARRRAAPDGRPRITVHGRRSGTLAAGRRSRVPDRERGADERAPARRRDPIDVTIAERDGRLLLSVGDDGRGLPGSPARGSTGLLAMENRAATIGAR